jgi:hypothetical protein
MGMARQFLKMKIKGGSGLARDSGTAIWRVHLMAAIANKPAPTFGDI